MPRKQRFKPSRKPKPPSEAAPSSVSDSSSLARSDTVPSASEHHDSGPPTVENERQEH
jgi:hypothetical protein